MSLFNELKRRNVFKVAVAYVIVSWLILQVVGSIVPIIEAPEWVSKAILIFLLAGFPIALLFAWAFELTPEGIKKESEIDRSESITAHTSRKIDFIIIAALVLIIGGFTYDKFFGSSTTAELAQNQIKTAELTSKQATLNKLSDSSLVNEKSIAVLPFVNMSSDSNQEYFADGISEEILNALVKATGLRVAGRTSSFSFKGKGATIKHIGEILKVAYVLEGSVRKQNQNVRITAQLIKANDGFHLWSETYDGNLDNIFDLQEDISRKVTKQLKLILKLDSEQRLATKLTTNIDAYDLFLRGREKVRKRIDNNIPEGIALLQKAVKLDPKFAEAWAKLAEAEAVSPGYIASLDTNLTNSQALKHIQKALEINSTLALPHAVKGLISQDQADYLAAIEYYTKALNLEPNNPIANRWLGNAYAILGLDLKALPLFEHAYALDPISTIDTYNLGATHFKLGDLEQSLRFFKLSGDIRRGYIDLTAYIYDYQGQTQKAIDFVLNAHKFLLEKNGPQNYISIEQKRVLALGVFNGSVEQQQAAKKIGKISFNSTEIKFPWQFKYHLALDDIDRVYEELERKPYLFSNFASDEMWIPIKGMKKFRADPRFINLIEKHKLPAAWQKIGWPKYCQPSTGTDGSNGQFQCQ
jgi:TolB-like protein/heme oxygenase